MRFWKAEAYLQVVYSDRVVTYNQVNRTGRMLALDFEIESHNGKDPNKAVCTIYNLATTTRDQISRDAQSIRIFAGYDGEHKLMFEGDIVYSSSVRRGPDWATIIQAGDGHKAYTQAITSKSYASGTDKQIILQQVASDMGLVLDAVTGAVSGVLDGSMSFDGKSKDVLDNLTQDSGADWSIQDGQIKIAKAGRPIDQTAIILAAESGLLEHPIITDKGVNIRAQLNPEFRPSKLIDLQSRGFEGEGERGIDYNGLYLIQSVNFIGNNYGGAFDANIEAIRYNG